MGRYHGDEGFLTFSNARAVLSKGKLNSAKTNLPTLWREIIRDDL